MNICAHKYTKQHITCYKSNKHIFKHTCYNTLPYRTTRRGLRVTRRGRAWTRRKKSANLMVITEVLAGSDSCWSAEMKCAALPASLPYSKSGAPTTRITDAGESACEGKRVCDGLEELGLDIWRDRDGVRSKWGEPGGVGWGTPATSSVILTRKDSSPWSQSSCNENDEPPLDSKRWRTAWAS